MFIYFCLGFLFFLPLPGPPFIIDVREISDIQDRDDDFDHPVPLRELFSEPFELPPPRGVGLFL